jgi:hypothetical protein
MKTHSVGNLAIITFRDTLKPIVAYQMRTPFLKSILLLLVSIILGLSVRDIHAIGRDQTAGQMKAIREDTDYVSAIGEGDVVDVARRNAEIALTSQIQVSIGVSTSYDSRYLEDDDALKVVSDYTTQHRSFAGMYFKGLQYLSIQQEKNWLVMAYIHRDSLAASFKLRRNRILELTSSALTSVKSGNLSNGLYRLYEAWLLARIYPEPVDFSQIETGLPTHAQTALSSLIERTLTHIRVDPADCFLEDSVIIAPLSFVYEGDPVKDLSFSYYGGQGMEYGRVMNGRADIPLIQHPTSTPSRLLLDIDLSSEVESGSDPELAGLAQMANPDEFLTIIPVSLRLPWLKNSEENEDGSTSPPSVASEDNASPDFNEGAEAIIILSGLRSTPEFLDMLTQFAKLGRLSYGRKGDYGDGRGCCVAVISEESVVAFLSFDGENYRSMDQRFVTQDLASDYKGKRQIWIKAVEKK